jgi:NAD(P)-dependent dehydrogenase (short-subunit alcohol dehydrogenase family)
VVNNAGVYVQGRSRDLSRTAGSRQLTGPFLCTKHAVPAMIKNGGGHHQRGLGGGLVGIRNQVAYN